MSMFDKPWATGDTVKLYLDDTQQHWIEIKVGLTIEEQRRMETAGWSYMSNIGSGDANAAKIGVEWHRFSLARTEAYLKAWSFDKPVSKATIAALTPEVHEAIEAAITAYVSSVADQKKVTSIATGSAA